MKPKHIKEIRAYLGISQAHLANIIGVNRTTVARWESGDYKPKKLERRVLFGLQFIIKSMKGGVGDADELYRAFADGFGLGDILSDLADNGYLKKEDFSSKYGYLSNDPKDKKKGSIWDKD